MKMSHMTLDDRVYIQEGLDSNLSPNQISKKIGKSHSTVIREIEKHKVFKGTRYEGAKAPCMHKDSCVIYGLCDKKYCHSPCRLCHGCVNICPEYFPNECTRLAVSPHVCNGCDKQDVCTYNRYFYIASYAHNAYQDTLISSREGINQTPDSLQELDDLVSPLLKKGQSVAHVFATHKNEINCSQTTVYRYVNDRVLTAMNMDLPRKVRYKARNSNDLPKLTKEEKLAVLSRSYERFKKYMKDHPDVDVVETC